MKAAGGQKVQRFAVVKERVVHVCLHALSSAQRQGRASGGDI
jgi:hypothetical protein